MRINFLTKVIKLISKILGKRKLLKVEKILIAIIKIEQDSLRLNPGPSAIYQLIASASQLSKQTPHLTRAC